MPSLLLLSETTFPKCTIMHFLHQFHQFHSTLIPNTQFTSILVNSRVLILSDKFAHQHPSFKSQLMMAQV